MLEKREERIKLLKEGYNTKIIEMLYIEGNNFKIIGLPLFIELLDVDIAYDADNRTRSKVAAKCA